MQTTHIFIGIDVFVANAFVYLIETGIKKREISYEKVVNYAQKAAEIYQMSTGKDVILLLSRDYQHKMLADYPDFFEADISGTGNSTFRLKDDVVADVLKEYFCWTLSVASYEALHAPEALNLLL